MKGLGKALVGGLLGAIFGFLISPKRAQQVRDALFGRSPGVSLEQPVRVAIPPAFQTAPMYPETDAPSLPLPAPVSTVVVEEESESENEPDTAALDGTAEVESMMPFLVPAEPPTADPELSALETSSFTPGRTMEARVLAALVGSSLTLVPPAEQESASEEPLPVEEDAAESVSEPAPTAPLQVEGTGPAFGTESEMRPALEVLERSSAGTDWSDSEADILSVDSAIDELEPEHAEEVGPEEEAVADVEPELEVETFGVVGTEPPPAPRSDPADLRARIEDTRERIRQELELSFAARGQQEVASEPEPAPEAEGEPAPVPSGTDGVPRTADGSFDQEAMRRRIEETRNRLKAKAFDAMMSGEASMLSRDSSSGPRASTAPPVPLDSEVAESIEKTLTEEEF